MTDAARDYSETLFLPKTDFPMRAGLPQKEPELLARWQKLDLYRRMREAAKGRAKFILHDGPPYANGNIHIGHALNKILKDVVTRSQQMLGYDSNYVPGWDCHGLPIEWKIEEENYRSKNKKKPDLSDPAAMIAFRRECRAYAEHWLDVQRKEFIRLGVDGDWDHPYTTMSFPAEAQIAREIMKFAANGTLYRGSKPVMWSVVEKTALAEAEVEYEDYTSDQIWVKFPIAQGAGDLAGASVLIWTTTPWTIPGNRAISYSPRIEYSLYEVTDAPSDNWAKVGDQLVIAKKLAVDVLRQARVTAFKEIATVGVETLAGLRCEHPLKRFDPGYGFAVPLLAGDHVTDDAGTGFVHTAPGHGRDDFDVWIAQRGEARRARHQHRHPLHRRRGRRVHRPGAGLHRQARAQRQGREGRRQRGRHQGADRGRHAARARPAQAPVPAFVALEEADHLPQHAAVVHRDGQAVRPARHARQRRNPAPARARRHQGHPLGAGRRREPHQRHDQRAPGLGDLAPARLGRADRGVRARDGRRRGRNPEGRARQPAHRRRVRAGRRRRLVRGRRGAALPRHRPQRQRMAQGRRHSRRLV